MIVVDVHEVLILIVAHILAKPLDVRRVRHCFHLHAHVISNLNLNTCQEIQVVMEPHHVLIVQKVCLAELRVIQWQYKVISCKVLNAVVVVAHHERVCLIVL